jgi:hypothetical protein
LFLDKSTLLILTFLRIEAQAAAPAHFLFTAMLLLPALQLATKKGLTLQSTLPNQ